MRALLLLVFFLFPLGAWCAPRAVSYPKAHNFRLSASETPEDWLTINPMEARSHWKIGLFFSRNADVPDLYADIKSKDQARIANRLGQSYGKPYDAAAKIHLRWSHGPFSQTASANAAAAVLVNDPVFPELRGILFNDFALTSSYRIILPWRMLVRPSLTYGLRRTMEHSFTVGQLLDTKPNLKIKTYPYRFFAEMGLRAFRPFAWGELLLEAQSLPVYQKEYSYWEVEMGARSANLLGGGFWLRRLHIWASAAPFYGGSYDFARTIKVGVVTEWMPFLESNVFLMDRFRLAAILRAGTPLWNAQLFTFDRGEDNQGAFRSREYGLSVNAGF